MSEGSVGSYIYDEEFDSLDGSDNEKEEKLKENIEKKGESKIEKSNDQGNLEKKGEFINKSDEQVQSTIIDGNGNNGGNNTNVVVLCDWDNGPLSNLESLLTYTASSQERADSFIAKADAASTSAEKAAAAALSAAQKIEDPLASLQSLLTTTTEQSARTEAAVAAANTVMTKAEAFVDAFPDQRASLQAMTTSAAEQSAKTEAIVASATTMVSKAEAFFESFPEKQAHLEATTVAATDAATKAEAAAESAESAAREAAEATRALSLSPRAHSSEPSKETADMMNRAVATAESAAKNVSQATLAISKSQTQFEKRLADQEALFAQQVKSHDAATKAAHEAASKATALAEEATRAALKSQDAATQAALQATKAAEKATAVAEEALHKVKDLQITAPSTVPPSSSPPTRRSFKKSESNESKKSGGRSNTKKENESNGSKNTPQPSPYLKNNSLANRTPKGKKIKDSGLEYMGSGVSPCAPKCAKKAVPPTPEQKENSNFKTTSSCWSDQVSTMASTNMFSPDATNSLLPHVSTETGEGEEVTEPHISWYEKLGLPTVALIGIKDKAEYRKWAEERKMQNAFRLFDVNQNNLIDRFEIMETVKDLGFNLTSQEYELLPEGPIDFAQFRTLVNDRSSRLGEKLERAIRNMPGFIEEAKRLAHDMCHHESLDAQLTNLYHMKNHYRMLARAKSNIDTWHYSNHSRCYHSRTPFPRIRVNPGEGKGIASRILPMERMHMILTGLVPGLHSKRLPKMERWAKKKPVKKEEICDETPPIGCTTTDDICIIDDEVMQLEDISPRLGDTSESKNSGSKSPKKKPKSSSRSSGNDTLPKMSPSPKGMEKRKRDSSSKTT